MKVRVDESLCIGSGTCEDICPKVFKVVDGRSIVQVDQVPSEDAADAQSAVESCPMTAIENVEE